MKKVWTFSTILSLICLGSLDISKAATKFYKIEKIGICPDASDSNPIIFFGNLSANYGKHGLKFKGEIPVRETVKGDLDVRILTIRCETNGANCVQYANRTFTKLCGIMSNNPLFGDTFTKITVPPFKCHPLKSKTLVMRDNTFDLTPLNMMPIELYRYKAKFYFNESPNDSENDDGRLLGCLNTETTVLAASSRRGGRGK